MLKILVVGATGVAGQAVIAACRRLYGNTCVIVGTTSRSKLVPLPIGLSCLVMKVDVSDRDWLKQVLNLVPGPYDFAFFCFARGEVGFPASEATRKQISEAHKLSLWPLIDLENSGQVGTVVGFGSFDELPIMRLVYGAMVYAKRSVERWVTSSKARPKSRYLVKSGAFWSQSLRGVKVFLKRQLGRRAFNNQNDALVRLLGNGDGDIQSKFVDRVLEEEGKYFGTNRLTERFDIEKAIEVVLHKPPVPVIAVVADKLPAQMVASI